MTASPSRTARGAKRRPIVVSTVGVDIQKNGVAWGQVDFADFGPASALRRRMQGRQRIDALDFAMRAFPQAGRDVLPDAKVFEAFLKTGSREALDRAIQHLQSSDFLAPAVDFTAKQVVRKAKAFDRYLKTGA